MANPQSGAGASSQQQAGAAPEDIWAQFIQDLYPDLLTQTYFLPPIHFNRTPQDVQTIAGQRVIVRDNPSRPPRRRHQPPPPPPQTVAGTLFVDIPAGTEAVAIQDSDVQDDNAQERCLRALSKIPSQVMVVISSLVFQKYLSDHTNPLHAAAIAQLPTIHDPSIPTHIQDGECDIVIIHRSYGLLVGELKSVGSSQYFRTQPLHQQAQMIKDKIEKALQQLENQERALRHLVHDLPHTRITKVLLLPNITSSQLQSALHMFPSLIQALRQALPPHPDLAQALRHCLCEQDERQPATWWQQLHTGLDPVMTDELYQRLVARFCGPASTVEVPTASPPHKVVVRSMGQAVAETGLRFSALTLTPTQITLLNTMPAPKFLHLRGPPGTGKTIVLLLKALQWARQGQQVVIVRGREDSLAVSILFKEQLDRLLSTGGPAPGTSTGGPAPGTSTGGPAPGTSTGGPAPGTSMFCCNFSDWQFDAQASVARLQQQLGPGPVLVLCDEVDQWDSDHYFDWIRVIQHSLPNVYCWSAGVSNMAMYTTLPPWLVVQTLQEALRCPPAVTTLLQQSIEIQGNVIPPYSAPQQAVATQGPPVQELQHRGQPGHSGDDPWLCDLCADRVIDIITRQLRVGQPGHRLQYRDLWILYGYGDPRPGDVLIHRLQQHGLPVRPVTRPLSQADARDLALALSDQILVAGERAVTGLERQAVIVLGPSPRVLVLWRLVALSRSSSFLFSII